MPIDADPEIVREVKNKEKEEEPEEEADKPEKKIFRGQGRHDSGDEQAC